MSSAVPFAEAVAILRWMVEAPDQVRALRGFDEAFFGPLPFFTVWTGEEAEITLAINGGVIVEVASIRVGNRFTNANGWIEDGNPWDELREVEADLLEISLSPRT